MLLLQRAPLSLSLGDAQIAPFSAYGGLLEGTVVVGARGDFAGEEGFNFGARFDFDLIDGVEGVVWVSDSLTLLVWEKKVGAGVLLVHFGFFA